MTSKYGMLFVDGACTWTTGPSKNILFLRLLTLITAKLITAWRTMILNWCRLQVPNCVGSFLPVSFNVIRVGWLWLFPRMGESLFRWFVFPPHIAKKRQWKKNLWLTFFLGAERCFVNTFAHQCRWAFLVLNSCEFWMIEFRFEKIGSLFTRIFHRKVLSGFNCCHSRWVQPSFFWTVFRELRIGGIAWASRLDTWAMERLRMWEMTERFLRESCVWKYHLKASSGF